MIADIFDNSKIVGVKNGMDELAKLLVSEEKNIVYKSIEKTLGYHHNTANDPEIAQLSFP